MNKDLLAAAREVKEHAHTHAMAAMDTLREATEHVRSLEHEMLTSAARSGDIDRCLRTRVEAYSTWCNEMEEVLLGFLESFVPDTVVSDLDLLDQDDRTVLIPTLSDLGPEVPVGAGEGLLRLLDRLSEVFDYPERVSLSRGYYQTYTLEVHRPTGHGRLCRLDNTTGDPRVVLVAEGPLDDVLRTTINPM